MITFESCSSSLTAIISVRHNSIVLDMHWLWPLDDAGASSPSSALRSISTGVSVPQCSILLAPASSTLIYSTIPTRPPMPSSSCMYLAASGFHSPTRSQPTAPRRDPQLELELELELVDRRLDVRPQASFQQTKEPHARIKFSHISLRSVATRSCRGKRPDSHC